MTFNNEASNEILNEIGAIEDQHQLLGFLTRNTGHTLSGEELTFLRERMTAALPNPRACEIDLYISALPTWFNIYLPKDGLSWQVH